MTRRTGERPMVDRAAHQYDRTKRRVYHLPAYVALQRWAAGRNVVVVSPHDADGPRTILQSGASRVCVVGGEVEPQRGIECFPDWSSLPMVTGGVDMILCIESYAEMPPPQRQEMLVEAKRLLSPKGLFAGWAHQGDESTVDFWTLEDELSAVFKRVFMVAELPWQGVSLAPVMDEEGGSAPALRLNEALLPEVPEASHYLAIATQIDIGNEVAQHLTDNCLLVPLPANPETSRLLEEHESAIRELQAELRGRGEAVKTARARTELVERELEERKAELQSRRAELEIASAQLDEAREEVEAQRGRLHEQQEALKKAAEVARAVEGLQNELEATTEALRAKESELVEARRVQQRVEALQRELGQIDVLQKQLAAAQQETEAVRQEADKVAGLEAQLTELKTALQSARGSQSRLEEQKRRLTAIREELEAAKAAERLAQQQKQELQTLRNELEVARQAQRASRSGKDSSRNATA